MSSQQAARVSSQSPGTWDRSSASSMPKSEGKGFRRGNSTILTFVDTVVSHEAFTDRLLLRELVHVVQYEKLGLKEFAANYVTGFLSGGSYEAITLEMNAHELDDRCEAATTNALSVVDEGQWWIDSRTHSVGARNPRS